MRIGLDVMGGDFAPPEVTIKGALLSLDELPHDVQLVLIGDEAFLTTKLSDLNIPPGRIETVYSSEVIESGEKPLKAISTKQNSSIVIGLRMLRKGEIDAFSSAGNSGAMLVGSMYSVGPIMGVIRPTTFAHIPQENGNTSILLDIGTNTDTKADVLSQFAHLGFIYAQEVMGGSKSLE